MFWALKTSEKKTANLASETSNFEFPIDVIENVL